MSSNITQYDLLISCPGDIEEEISIIEEVANEFNQLYSDVLHLRVRTKHWSKDSFSESGDHPQNLLNKQFINDCDAAVAIFWTRFGTATDKYGSGTEEEISIMIEAEKQVFMYFSEAPIEPALLNTEGYKKIQSFKNKYKDKGIYWTYKKSDEFQQMFLAHLSQYFLSKNKIDEIELMKKTKLCIKSISSYGFSEQIETSVFYAPNHLKSIDMKKDIVELYRKISDYELGSHNPMDGVFYKPVELSEDKKTIISEVARTLSIELTDSFFELGNLKNNIIAANVYGGGSITGTDIELQKYSDLKTLYSYIHDCVNWVKFEKLYEEMQCIKLCLFNEGTSFDEDIDILIRFPTGMLIDHTELPAPDEDTIDYLGSKYFFDEIFGIPRNIKYYDYSSSQKTINVSNYNSNNFYLPGMENSKTYVEYLDETFIYEYFYTEEYTSIKFHIDYLKHNNAIAFPTVLFVTEEISNITYEITSKHNPSIITGTLFANKT